MGFPQIASEMAAPPELRTPMGTAAQAAIRVRMEAWRQWRWSRLAEASQKSVPRRTEIGITGSPRWGIRPEDARSCYRVAKRGARNARMRRCLKLRQGARPLRPPAPFPSESMFQNGGNLSRVRKPRNNGAPLTDSLRSADSPEIRERGPQPSAPHVPPPVGRHAVQNQGRRTARYARMRRCLKLCQGASPLRPPQWPLTQAGLLMEAVTVGEWSGTRNAGAFNNRATRATGSPRGHPARTQNQNNKRT